MRWLAADSAEHSASRVRAWPKSCGGAGETFPRSVWGYPLLFERNSVLADTSSVMCRNYITVTFRFGKNILDSYAFGNSSVDPVIEGCKTRFWPWVLGMLLGTGCVLFVELERETGFKPVQFRLFLFVPITLNYCIVGFQSQFFLY
jgi:hypothetical protein